MRLPDRILLVALSAVPLAGCATSSLRLAPPAPDRPWVPATDQGGAIAPGSSARAAGPGAYTLPENRELTILPPPAAIDESRELGLSELIDIAQSSNPTTRVAWNEARNAALAVGIVESAYGPRVNATAIGGYRTSHGRASALGADADGNTDVTGGAAVLSVDWLLFDFGERRALRAAARQGSIIANIAFTAAHQRITHAVTLAFYADAAARARAGNVSRSVALAKDVQAAAEDRFKRGVGTVVEVAQARQVTAQAQLADVQAHGVLSDARLSLLTATGLSPFTRLTVLDVSGRPLTPALADPAEGAVSRALSRRPDMLAAFAAYKASLSNVEAAKATYRPKVFTSGNATYSHGDIDLTALPGAGEQLPTTNISSRRRSATILLGMTVPIFDGGVRDARLQQARDRADSAAAIIERTRDEAIREIAGANNALRTALSSYEASRVLVDAAKTTYDAAFGAYRNGVGTITAVAVAQAELLAADNASSDAYSASLSAAATLALAAGTLG